MDIKYYIINYPLAIIIVLLIFCIAFIILGHYYPQQLQSVLKHDIITVPATTLDYWSMSHFILFGIIGFLMPKQFWEWTIIGTTWELLEDYISSDHTTRLTQCDRLQPNGKPKPWCHGESGSYWYSKWDDIIVDILGFVVGSAVRQSTFDW
jgi:hypothetical protein